MAADKAHLAGRLHAVLLAGFAVLYLHIHLGFHARGREAAFALALHAVGGRFAAHLVI